MSKKGIDQMNRTVEVPEHPQRIVSLVPSQTELLYDLGLGDRVVGITKFCIHPERWKKTKTIVGGTKNFRFDAIEALRPDLIIGNKEENYEEGIHTLAASYPVWMSDIYNIEDALNMITSIGEITNTTPKAQEIASNIQQKFTDLSTIAKGTVAYFIWKGPYMLAGKNTFIDAMLTACGLQNVCEKERYVETSLEELSALKPDFVFLSSEPYPFKENNSHEIGNLLPSSDVRVVDGELFSWYGSRLLHSPEYFRELLG